MDAPARVRQPCLRTSLHPEDSSMIRWTGFVIAHRRRIVAAWLVLFVLGAVAAANVGDLLSNRFSVPGAESERGLNLLKDRMGDRSDGSFTLVATGVDTPADRAAFVAAARRGARAVEGAKAGPPLPAARGIVYAQIATPLENQDASKATPTAPRGDRAPGGHRDVRLGLPGDQPRHPEDLQRGPRARRVDRRADRDPRHARDVRDARRDLRADRLRGDDDPGHARARLGLRPLRWTWRST